MGKLAAFVIMFVITYITVVAAISFVPALMAFISWDITAFNPNWPMINFLLRLNVIFSAFMGICFVTSKEGKEFADQYNLMIKSKSK